MLLCLSFILQVKAQSKYNPVDYVNPYMGNISHMLVPTYPTVHLPNSMLRVYPTRENYTGNTIAGLPLIVTNHRAESRISINPYQGDISNINGTINYGYDNEIIKPYYYSVDLDDYGVHAEFAPSHQSAIYRIHFTNKTDATYLALNLKNGEIAAEQNTVKGYQTLTNGTNVYFFLETDIHPSADKVNKNNAKGENAHIILHYPNVSKVSVRYGISFISTEQARKNLEREIKDYNLQAIALNGRTIWNETLGKIRIEGDDEDAKNVFYTSLYRTYERMINISEDGNYFSAYDGKVHNDNGIPFYVDDWIWDTYRATHPLRLIIEQELESDMLNSYIRMAEQMNPHWMPTFPEVDGDKRCMNSNHGVAMILDAYNKGMRSFDLAKAYDVSKAAITERTLAPWADNKPAGELDDFYKEHGYFPALASGEKEWVPEVHGWEKRQPIAVTLGTVYDEWCLGNIAQVLNKKDEADYFLKRSLNYRKVFNDKTKFFHPKDAAGNFIEPFDYRYSGGIGAREAYDENNGWVYRWDVPHNIGDLVNMIGGKKAFVSALEDMYNTRIDMPRYEFYHQMPDHTGNVGQFSMGNEPSMHIPYLYNYAGEPWRTQKRIRTLLDQWFRNDLMGIPGDEDGGGLTAFVVFSQLGFYPVTPGLPMYVIGSPVFKTASINIGNGKTFTVLCHGYSSVNKYIQSAKLNGVEWNKSWFSHDDLMKGGTLEFVMGKRPNKLWGADDSALPPSFEME